VQLVEGDSLGLGLGLEAVKVLVHPSLLGLANLFARPLI
jgi:hypothetical protein